MIVLPLGVAWSGSPPEHWTPTEAVAWIASRSWYLVAGVLPYGCRTFDMGFGQNGAQGAPTLAVASDLEAGFCRCGRPHVDLSALRKWNELPPEARAAADEGADAEMVFLRKIAMQRHCVCFRDAERELFAAASAGAIVGSGQRLGVESEVARTAWVGANLQKSSSLELSTEGWVDVMFKRKAIQDIWPESGELRSDAGRQLSPRSRGRPETTARARAIMRDRAKAGVLRMDSVSAEAKACIEEQKRRHDNKPGEIPSVKACANALRAEWRTLVAATQSI